MGDRTGISWTDVTWNPVKGCSRVSEGCRHCYAEVQAARIVRMGNGKPTPYDGLVKLVGGEARWTGKVAFDARTLSAPLRWKKPRRTFVNSMSDLFHESLTNEQIAAVFGVMAACPQHTFQVLTKRARRMRAWFAWAQDQDPWSASLREAAMYLVDDILPCNRLTCAAAFDVHHPWPLPNVWLGVSVENQPAAHERIPDLLDTPAAVRFLSCEPLLGPVHLTFARGDGEESAAWLGWVIAGCESGPGARPCDVAWLRSLRDQCAAAGTAFFLKQAREERSAQINGVDAGGNTTGITCGTKSKRKTGGVIELPYLDGVQHAAFPESR